MTVAPSKARSIQSCRSATSARDCSKCASTLNDDAWPIGSPVRVQLAGANASRRVTVPRDAVILRQGAAYVFRVGAEEHRGANRRCASAPAATVEVEIMGDVCAEDRIVIRGGERLQPGQAVAVQKPRIRVRPPARRAR